MDPGSQFSVTYETRVDEDGRLVCMATQDTSGVSMLRQGPSSRDDDIQYTWWWEDPSTHVRVQEGQFKVLYKDFPSDEFREAFQHGVRIWDSILDPTIPVTIAVEYRPILYEGQAAAGTSVGHSCHDLGPHDRSRFCWPDALYNEIEGYDEVDDDPEFRITIREVKDSAHYPGGWHLEKDWTPPPDQLDLITIVLHEMTHGFGFTTGFRWSGCCEAKSHSEGWPFYPYDIFVWTQKHGRLTDLPSPSEELLEALGGDELLWGRTGWKNVRGEPMLTPEVAMGPVPLWYSARYQRGIDIVHMSQPDYPKGTVNSLMTVGYPGVALRHPGPIVMAMLYDIGWELKTDVPTTLPPPPPRRPEYRPPGKPENLRLSVTERGGWHQILVRWDEVPYAERYAIRLTSRSGKPRYSGTWVGYAKSPHRYLVRKSWGPFTIEVRAINRSGLSESTSVTWPSE